MLSADLILTGILLGGFAIFVFGLTTWKRVKEYAARGKLNTYDYSEFETEQSELPLLSTDLAPHGWKLTSTTEAEGVVRLYRFEKCREDAANLGDICLDFDRFVPLTSTRKSNALVKIKDYGLKR